VPSFLKDPTGAGASDVIANVNGHDVTVGDYRTAYQEQVQNLRAAYGGNLTDDMLKQFGIKERILQQMVDEQAVLAEADRLGVSVTDGELGERILRMPGLQEAGHFVGSERYAQMLQMRRPPLTTDEFEEQVRHSLISEKLQAAVSGWVRVADTDVDQEYRKKNEKVKLELAIFTANQFRAGVQPTDAEISAQFAAHQESYRMPEKRRVRVLSVGAGALMAKATVTTAEVDARFRQSASTYSLPEQVRASHILIKSDGKDAKKDEAAKKQAEMILAKAKAPGADFAALAKQYSQDDSNKDKGGDLDYFARDKMVKEFSDAAWALSPGQISGLVKSEFGYHIIKLVDKKPASTKTLAEVRPQIEGQIRMEKAQQEATKLADQIAGEIKKPEDLDRVAAAHGLVVADSGLFARDEPLAGLGFAPAVAAGAFALEMGKVSGAIKTDQGAAFITLAEVKGPYLPKLEEVKDKVRDDVIRSKALDLARAKAAALSQAGAKGNFAALAKTAGVEVKTTDAVARGSAYPEAGVNGAVDDAVFALGTGGVTQPITTDTAIVVARVVEKQDITADGLKAERDSLHDQLLQQKRQAFFGAYMAKAKQKMSIKVNDAVARALLGGT
jgi:peptidyl-prolyl cis-trans isomerase D